MTITEQKEYGQLIKRWIQGERTDELREEMRPYAVKYGTERTAKVRNLAKSLEATTATPLRPCAEGCGDLVTHDTAGRCDTCAGLTV